MNGSLLGTLTLGFVLGRKHARCGSPGGGVHHRRARAVGLEVIWVGAIWGIGHTASLFLAVTVIALRVSISPTVALSLNSVSASC
jgi:hypothetical protein